MTGESPDLGGIVERDAAVPWTAALAPLRVTDEYVWTALDDRRALLGLLREARTLLNGATRPDLVSALGDMPDDWPVSPFRSEVIGDYRAIEDLLNRLAVLESQPMTGESQVEEPRTEAGRRPERSLSPDLVSSSFAKELLARPVFPGYDATGNRHRYLGGHIAVNGHDLARVEEAVAAPLLARIAELEATALRQPEEAKDTRGEPR